MTKITSPKTAVTALANKDIANAYFTNPEFRKWVAKQAAKPTKETK